MMVDEYDTQSTFAYFFKISRKWNLIFTHLKLNFRKNVNDENRLRMRFYNNKMMSQVRIPKNWKIEGVWHTLLYIHAVRNVRMYTLYIHAVRNVRMCTLCIHAVQNVRISMSALYIRAVQNVRMSVLYNVHPCSAECTNVCTVATSTMYTAHRIRYILFLKTLSTWTFDKRFFLNLWSGSQLAGQWTWEHMMKSFMIIRVPKHLDIEVDIEGG